MAVQSTRAESWNHLNALLWDGSYDAASGKYRAYTAFRGQDEDYSDLPTKLQRSAQALQAAPNVPGSIEWKERRMLDSFRTYERLSIHTGNSDWDTMLLGQHHGLPTRLLDWTSSPLMALFFATENYDKHDKDGAVWCVRRLETSKALHDSLRAHLEKQRTWLFSLETLSSAYPTLAEFDKLSCDNLLFFEPPSVSPRIIAQYSLFSVMPGVRTQLASWLHQHADWCRKIIIPAQLKREIREKLMIMNVSERTVYPGLDGTCKWIASWYR